MTDHGEAGADLEAVKLLRDLRERLGADSPLLAEPEYETTEKGRIGDRKSSEADSHDISRSMPAGSCTSAMIATARLLRAVCVVAAPSSLASSQMAGWFGR